MKSKINLLSVLIFIVAISCSNNSTENKETTMKPENNSSNDSLQITKLEQAVIINLITVLMD